MEKSVLSLKEILQSELLYDMSLWSAKSFLITHKLCFSLQPTSVPKGENYRL